MSAEFPHSEIKQGKILFYNGEYGFIQDSNEIDEYYFNWRGFDDHTLSFNRGDNVEFEYYKANKEGLKPIAHNIKKIN